MEGYGNLLTYERLNERGITYTSRHLLRLEKNGKFPPRVYLSTNHVVWSESEINNWISNQIERRNAKIATGGGR